MSRVLPPYGDYTKLPVAWGVVIVACVVNFLDLFQSSMVMFGLSDIQKSLNINNSDLNWILVAYTLTFATILPVGGQMADRVGLRSTFLIGTFMLFWTNILISWTPNQNGLLAGRALAGAGAALTVGVSIFHISRVFLTKSHAVRNGHLGHQSHIPTWQESKHRAGSLCLMWTGWYRAGRHSRGLAHGILCWLALDVLGKLHFGRYILYTRLLDHSKL
jgi:hypothetical protein